MDLDTENRIAAILMKEAAELRRQAQSEGALAYLRQPTVRSRPNSRFLTATVRGVQQANRVVEVNEMWRLREKQLELDNRLRGARNERGSGRGYYKDACESRRSTSRERSEAEKSSRSTSRECNEAEKSSRSISRECNEVETSAYASRKRSTHDLHEDEGLKDDEVDEFLHSRTKRGRGTVGSRMDETGPYLPSSPDSKRNPWESNGDELKRASVLLGPEKPHSLKSSESSDDESDKDKKRKARKGSSKRHSKKHKSKEKSRDKNKKNRKEKRSKYHK